MAKEKKELGLVHVYTGDGKGKTTAALGLAMRAAGHGLKVHMIQFMKGDINYGELASAEFLPNITIIQFGRPTFVDYENPAEEDRKLAQDGLAHARKVMADEKPDLLILDELNVAVDFRLISAEDVCELLDAKPQDMEIVITGRRAHEKVIARADYVTEMMKIKHPYDSGILGRLGIEH
jgi:cob(I)alamin adenosyltransferase